MAPTLNAQVGRLRRATIGADVSRRWNLHKTFCIPWRRRLGHSIGFAAHLAPFMADHGWSAPVRENRRNKGQGAGFRCARLRLDSADQLDVHRTMGGEGLKRDGSSHPTRTIAARLQSTIRCFYTGTQGRVAHEHPRHRPIKASCGVTEVDIAKRLMDYGFYAPTIFPVAGTIMVEPTGMEDLGENGPFTEVQ